MSNEGKIISSVFGFVIGIYVMSVMAMSSYYWWVDVKNHESFMRSVLVSPVVGFVKATHWPYYAFLQKYTEKQKDPAVDASVKSFFTGYDYMLSANNIAKNMRNTEDVIGDFKKTKTLFENAKTSLNECSRDILNQVYPEWGDKVKDKFIPGVEYYLTGSTPKGDRTNLARGDAMIAEFSSWLEDNWNNILLELNKQGYEIKK